MDKKMRAKEMAQARWAYETLSRSLEGRRLDGTPIPKWDELSLNAQWKCGSVVDVLLHFSQQQRIGE